MNDLSVKEFDGDYKNDQEVFDYITSSIIRQGGPAMDSKDGLILFHVNEDLRCAIGWLIKPEDLPNTEEKYAKASHSKIVQGKVGNFKLVQAIQVSHDRNSNIYRKFKFTNGMHVLDIDKEGFLIAFKEDMIGVAKKFGLKYK